MIHYKHEYWNILLSMNNKTNMNNKLYGENIINNSLNITNFIIYFLLPLVLIAEILCSDKNEQYR